jgi:hypothetical protein
LRFLRFGENLYYNIISKSDYYRQKAARLLAKRIRHIRYLEFLISRSLSSIARGGRRL